MQDRLNFSSMRTVIAQKLLMFNAVNVSNRTAMHVLLCCSNAASSTDQQSKSDAEKARMKPKYVLFFSGKL